MTTESYDVVIIGGGVIGSSTAYFLASQPDFQGRIAVIEKDSTYEAAATPRSAGGVRQQFSTPENVVISQFAAQFYKSIDAHLAVGNEKPAIQFRENGYLFLATHAGLKTLVANHRIQHEYGAATELWTPQELEARFPWVNIADLAGATFGPNDEGWIDPYGLLQAFRKKARSLDVTYIAGEVVGLEMAGNRVAAVKLKEGGRIACATAVNSAGYHARTIAGYAGIDLPVHPRKRFIYVFDCREEFESETMPLTIDPSGVWWRPESGNFICGVSPEETDDPDCTDFELDYRPFEELIWPTLAHRVPVFEAIKLVRAWAGHYDYNVLDQNVLIGPAPQVPNLHFANGFSGHGLQQSPAIGRALSELITYGEFRTIDLSRLSFARVASGALMKEDNIV
ncbi:MAG TPA: FAD-binding oxidoreductase [Dongiaceae bacterium]|jgi:sarcosine oxidase|nr:FAD-binding oxidoreductase [Dongiaceae bacterium]